MKKKCKLGFIGARGMVGQVLLERMMAESDFDFTSTTFYSSSKAGLPISQFLKYYPKDAIPLVASSMDMEKLLQEDVIISTQGGSYTEAIYPQLMAQNFKGYFIDASSHLRLSKDALIVLDPINQEQMKSAILNGVRTFVGGNCTVSLMLLSVGGILSEIDWISSMTYQAASGAGSALIENLLSEHKEIALSMPEKLSALEMAENAHHLMNHHQHKNPLAFNLHPFIDNELPSGQSREEWKGQMEASKILGKPIIIDGTCVRVGALRCHSQGLLIKLKKHIPLPEVYERIASHNPWVQVVANQKEETLKYLTPHYTAGTLRIPIGRIRYTNMGDTFLNAFTVGDQLLWGAAEPLRRTFRLLLSEGVI